MHFRLRQILSFKENVTQIVIRLYLPVATLFTGVLVGSDKLRFARFFISEKVVYYVFLPDNTKIKTVNVLSFLAIKYLTYLAQSHRLLEIRSSSSCQLFLAPF